MRALAALAAPLLTWGCSSPATPPTTIPVVPGGSAAPVTPPGQLPSGPPLVTPGEHMTYRLSLQGVELASYTIAVDKLAEVAGRRAIVVQGHAKSVGLVTMVAAIDDKFTSWIDVQTGRPLRFQADEFATGSKTDVEHAIADIAARTADSVPCTFALNDAPPTAEPQKVARAETWDLNSFMVALRSWEGPPGTTATLETFRSRYLWHIEAKIAAKEKLVTELGELPALRIEATTYKLDRQGQRDPDSDERHFSVWISDDGGRVPLQIVARTDYGDIKMQIVEYDAGSGSALR